MGRVDFDAAVGLMDWLAYDLSGRTDGRGVLLLCEHPVGLSLGAEASRGDLSEAALDGEVPYRWVTRGGGVGLHGPGQLAVYPLIPLRDRGLGVAAFSRAVRDAVVESCGDLKVPAFTVEDSFDVDGRGGRMATFGASVRHGVTTHGAHWSVDPEPGLLLLGDRLKRTSVALQRTKPDLMHSARQAVLHRLIAAFGYDRFHVHTGHPMLTRVRRPAAKPQPAFAG